LIANTDRHHENWGATAIAHLENKRLGVLAPTYDHASSLGRELSDDARRRKYTRADGTFEIAKARSAIYADSTDTAPLSPIDAFRAFARRPAAAGAWLGELARLTAGDLCDAVDAVPDRTMSALEKDFARGILRCTRLQLQETRSV
jgi:hypothetical protein